MNLLSTLIVVDFWFTSSYVYWFVNWITVCAATYWIIELANKNHLFMNRITLLSVYQCWGCILPKTAKVELSVVKWDLPRASEVFCVGVVFACSPQGQLNRKTCFLTTVLSCFFFCFFWILNVCILLQPNPILVYLLVYLVYLYTRSKFSRF